MRALALSGLLVGCTFSTQTPGPGPDDGCPFDFTPEYVDPCKPAPRPLEELVDVTITGMAAIDTGNGDIVGANVFTSPPSNVIDGVRVVWAHNFTIASGGALRAYGDLPLAIIATGSIRIEGMLDASSSATTRGAGARSAAVCGAASGRPGLQCAQHGGSGGGGGGFGAAGGPGGEGGDTHDCGGGATSGQPGGGGGMASGKPAALQGGCGGGDGQPSNAATGVIGVAGAGGGAIALIAADKVLVAASGVVQAGGGGGQPGFERAGGGGGGSGGMIFLESIDVDLQAGSWVAANGGGGAGGCDSGTGEAGEPGLASADDADGGDQDGAGGKGGDGGVIAAEAGTAGALATRGGGGGGGGVGYMRVHAKTGSQTGMASPAISPN